MQSDLQFFSNQNITSNAEERSDLQNRDVAIRRNKAGKAGKSSRRRRRLEKDITSASSDREGRKESSRGSSTNLKPSNYDTQYNSLGNKHTESSLVRLTSRDGSQEMRKKKVVKMKSDKTGILAKSTITSGSQKSRPSSQKRSNQNVSNST